MAANILQTLIPLLSSIAVLIAAANSQSTSFTYDFYGDQPNTLTYQGDAHFPSETTYLRLTGTNATGYPQFYSLGRVVHSSPVQFRSARAQADFETTLKFLVTPIDGMWGVCEGITFFIAPVGYGIPAGSEGGSFGIFNPSESTPSVFAVEFDFNLNFWDPRYRHIGIDIESRRSVNTTQVDDSLIGQEATARISYASATKLISVNVAAGSQNFEVTYTYDLGTFLPEQVEVGLSSTTGPSVAIFDIISWYFTSTLVENGAAYIQQVAGLIL